MDPTGSSGAPLYAFNIEELYDYDLPNIRRPSEALTAATQADALGWKEVRQGGSRGGGRRERRGGAGGRRGGGGDGRGAPHQRRRGGQLLCEEWQPHARQVRLPKPRAHGRRVPAVRPGGRLARADRPRVFHDVRVRRRPRLLRRAEVPSEFIQLSTWMQQSTFFNVLSSIRFFKHYLAAKIFRLWRANVRYKLYVAQRNKLVKKLFLAKPAFCSTLLEINALCYELRTSDKTRLNPTVSPNFVSIGKRLCLPRGHHQPFFARPAYATTRS